MSSSNVRVRNLIGWLVQHQPGLTFQAQGRRCVLWIGIFHKKSGQEKSWWTWHSSCSILFIAFWYWSSQLNVAFPWVVCSVEQLFFLFLHNFHFLSGNRQIWCTLSNHCYFVTQKVDLEFESHAVNLFSAEVVHAGFCFFPLCRNHAPGCCHVQWRSHQCQCMTSSLHDRKLQKSFCSKS